MKQIYVESYYLKGYTRFMRIINDILDHPRREHIEQRVRIIEFFDKYGAEATKAAFGRSRSTVFLWKHKLKKAGGRLSALAPGDKAPINKRKRIVPPFIESFIVNYRTAHPGADKTTITPALKAACTLAGVKPVSESTVGRIIHDLKEKGRLLKSNKVTINGRTGNLLVINPRPRKRKMRRKSFVPQLPGDLVQMDTVSIFAEGIKRYIFTAIDLSTRFAFAYAYKSNSSANGSDFLGKLLGVVPFAIKRIQTDNGSEFAKHFNRACENLGLDHFFNYPKHPQSNGCLERFNRTLQEQCVNQYSDYLHEPETFNVKLMDYLIWYNTEKPHRGIHNLPPLRFYLNRFLSNPQKSNMLWTLTSSCQDPNLIVY